MILKNKVALITGSSRGIGRAIALLFAKHGAKVIVNYKNSRTSAEKVLEKIKASDSEGIVIQADVGNPDDVKSMFNKILDEYGTIDILVNNAGFAVQKDFLKQEYEDWKKIFDTNLFGVFLCSKEAAKIMKNKQKGVIVNVSSLRGLENHGRPPICNFSAAKAGVINFTKTLAKGLAPNIRVNSVAPGMTKTDIVNNYSKEMLEKFSSSMLINRFVEPEEVAQAVLFLASDDSSAITGEILVVDGGQRLK